MLGKTYDSQVCSIARSLELVGERWSLLILRNALFAGSTRYGEFQRSLGDRDEHPPGPPGRVRRGRDHGATPVRGGSRELHGYVLTEKGRDFAPALIALTQWGDKWAAPDGPPILYRHATCGSAVSVEVRCAACGELDGDAEVLALPGPGMPADRAERILERLAGRGSPVAAR